MITPADVRRARVLVVDDQPVNVQLLEYLLKTTGYENVHSTTDPRQVVSLHVLKNIGIPIVTVFGLEFGSTLAFAVVTETVFNWPGMGKLIIESIASLDRPIMVAYLVLVVLLFVGINLVVELTYGLLDPRVRAR